MERGAEVSDDKGEQERGDDGVLAEAEITGVQNETLIQTRREQICDAALELFLEKGFASTTIRDICARSGVNQASIYDYIANKNDILRRLLNQLWFRKDVSPLPELLAEDRSLEDIFTEYFREVWDKKRKGTLLIYRSVPHLQAEDRQAMRKRDRALIEDLVAQLRRRAGLQQEDARLEVMANLLVFLSAFGPMRDWLTRHIDDELVLKTVVAGAAAMVRQVISDIEDD
nr:TetR/AcrR family transcriptional regulator [Seohaeicola saemankumensis]